MSIDNKKLLDAGCGDGRLFHVYQQASFEVVGVDIARDMVLAAQGKGDAPVYSGEVENTGQAGDVFGMVVAWGVLDSSDQNRALHHLLGRLQRGGVLLCSGKNRNYAPDDTQALLAEYNAALKLFPNGFSDFGALTAALQGYGGLVHHAFYAPRRGDMGKGKYTEEPLEHFYEWVLVIEKKDETPLRPFPNTLSQPASLHFAHASELFGLYSAQGI